MKTFVALAAGVALAFGVSASAGTPLPTPKPDFWVPNTVYPGKTKINPSTGYYDVDVYGGNLEPLNADGKPLTFLGGYVHIAYRTVALGGNDLGLDWKPCAPPACIPIGKIDTYKNVLQFEVEPSLLETPGTQFVFRLWVSDQPDLATDPDQATHDHSGWSVSPEIVVAKPTDVPPAPDLEEVSPPELVATAAKPYPGIVVFYGPHICEHGATPIFNGAAAPSLHSALVACGQASGNHVDWLSFDYPVPAAAGKPGTLSLAVRTDYGTSQTLTIPIMNANTVATGGAKPPTKPIDMSKVKPPLSAVATGGVKPPVKPGDQKKVASSSSSSH